MLHSETSSYYSSIRKAVMPMVCPYFGESDSSFSDSLRQTKVRACSAYGDNVSPLRAIEQRFGAVPAHTTESPGTNCTDMVSRRRLRLLTIGGSDSGGGAGIQADLKTFAAYGVYGMSAITALTAQNTREVRAVQEVTPSMVADQIDAVLQDIGADAIKIGMLANAGIVRVVAERLRSYIFTNTRAVPKPPPIVLDPVMFAKNGASLLDAEAIEVMVAELLPLATVVTPNLPELEQLTGLPVAREDERCRATEFLAAHGPAVLAKGGHAIAPIEGEPSAVEGIAQAPAGENFVIDLLLTAGCWYRFSQPRLASRSTHGTGCTLSSAIAVHLAAGEDLPSAVSGGLIYLHGAIAAAYPLGSGWGPVDHLYLMQRRMT